MLSSWTWAHLRQSPAWKSALQIGSLTNTNIHCVSHTVVFNWLNLEDEHQWNVLLTLPQCHWHSSRICPRPHSVLYLLYTNDVPVYPGTTLKWWSVSSLSVKRCSTEHCSSGTAWAAFAALLSMHGKLRGVQVSLVRTIYLNMVAYRFGRCLMVASLIFPSVWL